MASASSDDGSPKNNNRKWASEEDFNKHRKVITDLYNTGTLPNLMQTMETEYGFHATQKMYKTRFRRWGLWKHNRADHVAEIVRIKKQRDAAHKPSEFIINGRRVDLERVESYLRRNERMRRYATSVSGVASADPPLAPDAAIRASAVALVCRTPSPEPEDMFLRAPDELQNEESMYRAIRDYYDGAFSSGRWVFDNNPELGDDTAGRALVAHRTKEGLKHGQEIWLRFRTALNMLERPNDNKLNGGKEGDWAQGVRLMRIAFAELSQNIVSGCEAPMLLFWIMHVMTLFRESSMRDFQPVERQLLKHLYDLTSATPGGSRHATSFLWRILWSGGRGIARDRYHLQRCTAVALKEFARHIGDLHEQSIELVNFSIFTSAPSGTGNPAIKTARFRDVYLRLEKYEKFGDRHLDVLCCWASHYRHHRMLDEGEELLLANILRNPERVKMLPDHLGAAFNVHSLLTSMNCMKRRYDVAEGYIRKAIEIAKAAREKTGEDGDMFEGLNGLEVCLRGQGKTEEADAVEAERQALVRESLEKVGEKEDSA